MRRVATDVRILSYNIRRGGVGREVALASVIRAVHPDIVVLEEATRPDVVERLALDTGCGTGRRRRANRSPS